MRLTPSQLSFLQEAYNYLTDLGEDDPPSIDPATWQSPEDDRLIHIAALHGNLAAVEILLDAGENVNAIGDMGQTPAHYAAMGQHRHVFDFLSGRGADTTIVDEFGNTPIQTWASTEKRERWASTKPRWLR